MQRTRSRTPRVRIAAAVVALFAAALLPHVEAAAPAGTLDHIRQMGKLTLGYRTDAQPFSYRDESGNAAGYSVALCQKIAEQLKVELGVPALALEWVPVTLEGRFRDLKQGKIDLLCGADSVTLTRRKEVSFSIPVFPGGIGALLRADSSYRLRQILTKGQAAPRPFWRAAPAEVLQQQAFSAVSGTTSETWLAERMRTFKIAARVVPVEDYATGVRRVLERSTNVLFADRAILLDAATRSPSARDLIVLDRQFTYEPLALGLPRGDEDFRLAVDRILSRLFTTGEFRDLYMKWFGTPDESALMFFRMSALPE